MKTICHKSLRLKYIEDFRTNGALNDLNLYFCFHVDDQICPNFPSSSGQNSTSQREVAATHLVNKSVVMVTIASNGRKDFPVWHPI